MDTPVPFVPAEEEKAVLEDLRREAGQPVAFCLLSATNAQRLALTLQVAINDLFTSREIGETIAEALSSPEARSFAVLCMLGRAEELRSSPTPNRTVLAGGLYCACKLVHVETGVLLAQRVRSSDVLQNAYRLACTPAARPIRGAIGLLLSSQRDFSAITGKAIVAKYSRAVGSDLTGCTPEEAARKVQRWMAQKDSGNLEAKGVSESGSPREALS